MKYAIVGSQKFSSLHLVESFIKKHLPIESTVVTGDAEGVDSLVYLLCTELHIPVDPIKAEWTKYGKAAGMIRNPTIIKQADKVLAFWDGKSKGTKNAIDLARKHKKPLLIIFEDGEKRREEPIKQPTLWD